jgi:hypothetical protein
MQDCWANDDDDDRYILWMFSPVALSQVHAEIPWFWFGFVGQNIWYFQSVSIGWGGYFGLAAWIRDNIL